MELVTKLRTFRQAAYERFGKAHDAMFELTDAILLTRHVYCLADLSLCPVFRRLACVSPKPCKTADHNGTS